MKKVRILLFLVLLAIVVFFAQYSTWISKDRQWLEKLRKATSLSRTFIMNAQDEVRSAEKTITTTEVKSTSISGLTVSSMVDSLTDPPGEEYDAMFARKAALQRKFLASLVEQQKMNEVKGDKGGKYLILYPIFSGLGNNMAVLAEAILVCFLTNRRFYLYKWDSFDQYFDLPFSNYVMKDDSFLSSNYIGSDTECTATPEEILHSDKTFVVLRSTCKLIDYITFNEEFWPFLHQHGFILHPHLKSGADIRKTIYSFLYNSVITLKGDIAADVKRLKDEHHWDEYYMIGIQIRTGKMGTRDSPTFFLDLPDIDLFTRYALQQTEKARNKTSKPIKWFVACDNKVVKAKIRSAYPKYFLSNSCILAHSNRDLERNKRSSGMLCSLYDSYLLSSVDEAIITAKSTFGIMSINRNPQMKRIQIMKGDWKALKATSKATSPKTI